MLKMLQQKFGCILLACLFLMTLNNCGIVLAPLAALAPKTYVIQNSNPNNGEVFGVASPNDPTVNGKNLVESVVHIYCDSTKRPEVISGSGFLHKSGNIITAAHVIEDCDIKTVRLYFADGTTTGIGNSIYNKGFDVAILYPDPGLPSRKIVLISTASEVTIGEQVSIWGFPDGVPGSFPKLTVGYISGYDDTGPFGSRLWEVNAAINLGNSGSPVIRISDGSIVGMVVSIPRRSTMGVGYIVPAAAIRQFLEQKDIGIAP